MTPGMLGELTHVEALGKVGNWSSLIHYKEGKKMIDYLKMV